jgi:ssRNA-specific RNase YbeY (16S rRNA maturation enzyme)
MKLSSAVMTMLLLLLHRARSFTRIIPPTPTRTFSRRFFASTSTITTSSSIDIYNEQDSLQNINQADLRNTISKIRSILGYDTHSIQLILCDDDTMQERNLATRGVDAPTDILSFPFLDFIQPGVLKKPQFDIPDYYNMGDCIVDVPYVMRRCKEDQDYHEGYSDSGNDSDGDHKDDDESDSDDVYDDERGVSGAMATVYDPEKRIHMLLVHGMLHLVGYDHIEDDDYELMVAREEEILKELKMMEET